MYSIYKVYNDVNDKLYIGQTAFGVEKRFREHTNKALSGNYNHRPLYSAMNKYGVDKFHIVEIESGLTKAQANERERFYIALYDTFKGDGYNATVGGDDGATHSLEVCQIDMNTLEVIATYPSTHDAARALGKKNNAPLSRACNHMTPSMYGFYWSFSSNLDDDLVMYRELAKKTKNIRDARIVEQIDDDGNVIATFVSPWDAENQLGITHGHIKRVCRGERKSCAGLKFRYAAA